VLASKTQQIAAAHFEKQGGAAPENAVTVWAGKIVRMLVGAVGVGAGSIMLYQLWRDLQKAQDFGLRHTVMIGLALLVLAIGGFIWTPDRAKDTARFVGSLLMLWRKQPKGDA
jgi:hypothetical protein